MSKLKLGINKDISNEDYHAGRQFISSSGLKTLLRDPELYERIYVHNDKSASKSSSAMDFGSYVHTLILEPHLLGDEYAIYPGKVKRGKNYDLFKENNPGKIILKETDKDAAFAMKKAFDRNDLAIDLLTTGEPEVTLGVELDGVKVKVRCDWLNDEHVVDLKTTFYGVSLEEITSTCLRYDYDLSAALYCDAFYKATGKWRDFVFIFISKQEPCACQVVKASRQFIENGRRKYKAAIKKLKKARETGIYYEPKKFREIYIPASCRFETIERAEDSNSDDSQLNTGDAS